MRHSSHVEISKSAYLKNLKFLRRTIGRETLLSSVVKGNAYGHGIATFLPMAESCGVRHFSVFSAEEAYLAHRASQQDSRILIMGYIDPDELEWAVDHGVAFFVFDLPRLNAAVRAAEQVKRPAKIHLEIETGMNRTGFEGADFEEAISIIKTHPDEIIVEGACTHLAGAESVANYLRVTTQLEIFEQACRHLRELGITPAVRHTACSAASLNYPQSIMDMVRMGIAQYGYWPNKETQMHYELEHEDGRLRTKASPLKGVLRWVSRIMSLKRVKRGQFVGYGTTYQAMRNQTLATVPVGYYHGFSRSLSNLGHVLVNGRRAPVVGLVNMNMMMIDVTDCNTVGPGDEVTLIGPQRRSRITVSSFSDLSSSVNYEVLVRIPSTIPRVVVD